MFDCKRFPLRPAQIFCPQKFQRFGVIDRATGVEEVVSIRHFHGLGIKILPQCSLTIHGLPQWRQFIYVREVSHVGL